MKILQGFNIRAKVGRICNGLPWTRIGLMLCLSVGLASGLLSCAQPRPKPPPSPEQVPAALVGRWQGVDVERLWNGNETLIFQPDGNFIAIGGAQNAAMGNYWIKPASDPMPMDLTTDDPYSNFRGIFRFLDEHTLELQEKLVGLSGPFRPSTFTGVRLIYKRVNHEPKLPADIQTVKNRQPPISLRENMGQDYIVFILFAQRDYFDRERRFNTDFFQPSSGFQDEDRNYTYRITAQGDNLLWIFGQAKDPQLRSFTGGLATSKGYASTIRLCRSKQPSQQPPSMYKMNDELDFQCGADGEPR